MLLVLAANFIYFPINRMLTGGVVVETPLDRLIPLAPVWAVPYILALPWWTAALLWAAIQMDDATFKTMIVASLMMVLSSDAFYILFPTYLERPQLAGDGWAMNLMRMIYGTDRAYCALPSGHTYNTTLIASFWWFWQPRYRWLWALTVPVVILATLFTRQHNILDVVSGMIWALVSIFIAARLTGWRPEAKTL